MREGGRFRRGVGTPPYARILSGAVGRPALWPPPKTCGGGKLRAAYMRPLQVNRKRDMASGCGPGMPGPYRGGDGEWDIIISLRRWEGAAAANQCCGCRISRSIFVGYD